MSFMHSEIKNDLYFRRAQLSTGIAKLAVIITKRQVHILGQVLNIDSVIKLNAQNMFFGKWERKIDRIGSLLQLKRRLGKAGKDVRWQIEYVELLRVI